MRRLRNRYRLVILKDYDLAEKASFSIRGVNVVAFLSIVLVITFLLFWALFSYTPMVYFLPVSQNLKKEQQLNQLARKTDSLTQMIQEREAYFNNIRTILRGNVPDTLTKTAKPLDARAGEAANPLDDPSPLREDSLLNAVEPDPQTASILADEEQEAALVPMDQITFFTPLEGLVTASYDAESQHPAVDVVAAANSNIKAVKQGHVIYTGWSANTGYVIMLQHDHGLISVYKHNADLLKSTGSMVEAGEPIGLVGTSGELSTGPHLHFELWREGTPLNPQDYINFE